MVDILDTLDEILALGDLEGDEFGGVGATDGEVGKLLVLAQAILLKLVDIVDFRYGGDGKTAEVRVDHDGLSLGVTDDTDAHIAGHLGQVLGELGTEMRVLDIVNALMGLPIVEGGHTGTLGAQM